MLQLQSCTYRTGFAFNMQYSMVWWMYVQYISHEQTSQVNVHTYIRTCVSHYWAIYHTATTTNAAAVTLPTSNTAIQNPPIATGWIWVSFRTQLGSVLIISLELFTAFDCAQIVNELTLNIGQVCAKAWMNLNWQTVTMMMNSSIDCVSEAGLINMHVHTFLVRRSPLHIWALSPTIVTWSFEVCSVWGSTAFPRCCNCS